MIRKLGVLMLICAQLAGCVFQSAPQKYTISWFDTFDTVITLTGYAGSRELFDRTALRAHEMLLRLDAVFDRYEAHDGISGVYALNHAGGAPVKVEPELMELLRFSLEKQNTLSRQVNVAMGAVLDLWHDEREIGERVPDLIRLQKASGHIDPDRIMIDEKSGLVTLTDPMMSLDMGAVAKGYAVEMVAQFLEAALPNALISGGGNVRALQSPPDREGWNVGIQDPSDNQKILMTLRITDVSVVSSGSYQRYYEVNGVRYHHLIDPGTLMPGNQYLQTTVITKDSGLADFLSTAAFLMPYEDARALIDSLDDAACIWVMNDGSLRMTDGVSDYIYESVGSK